jgi:hypothetical protein
VAGPYSDLQNRHAKSRYEAMGRNGDKARGCQEANLKTLQKGSCCPSLLCLIGKTVISYDALPLARMEVLWTVARVLLHDGECDMRRYKERGWRQRY